MAEEDLIFGKNRHFFGGIEPSNMQNFTAVIEGEHVKITAQLPADTVINGQTLCTVEGAVIRRKTTDYPKDEFDGEEVSVIKTSTTFVDSETSATGTYYYAAFPFTTQGVYNRNKANRVVVNEPEPMEESGGGILAVWGSPGCGKTVTAVKIAKHLAAQKKNTVLLLCDMTAPMMPCICPPSELEVDKSLGSIFAAQHISVNLIKHNLTTLKRLPHLTMLGLRKKENEYTYAPCTKQQAEELIRGLREIVPYVVIDCSSYIANDILSAVALMEADSVLQLASCDLKSVGYLSSQLPLLGELKWDKDKQYRVASNIKPFQAADRIGQVLGSVVFRLPYSQELEEQYLAGELLADLSMKDSRAFRKEINRICKEVF